MNELLESRTGPRPEFLGLSGIRGNLHWDALDTAYCDQHRQFDGPTFPTRRRVLPRGPGDRVLSRPTLLALDFDDIEIKC